MLGLRYGDERFNLELRGNHLTSAAEFEQWGAKARLGYSPATDGTGLNLALTSQWDAAENGDSFLDGHTIELPTPALVSAQGDSLPAENQRRDRLQPLHGSAVGHPHPEPGL
ncbi:MAG: hypothetical protein ERJ67_04895 [Aphanocapsa feldmannii 277cV]|uniref:Uncharacterized protein n=1 Tax=Aphanocapsa feldmannii 277cV TaxID=2507553 RepID=A0A524RP21_9CHRO|nr:MAG: hypothetical protein ERJ67_04895 [Aphanocapsa feldmannii 277cV]